MKELTLTPEQIAEAIHMDLTEPQYKDSFENGEGRLAGFAAQIAVRDWLGGYGKPTFDYDMLWDYKRQTYKLEVKSKRHKAEIPILDNYESNTSPKYHQFFDIICFCRTAWDFEKEELGDKVWVMCFMTMGRYKKKRRFRLEGEIDPSNGQKCPATCWEIKYKDGNFAKELMK
jgi:hypothetical protein